MDYPPPQLPDSRVPASPPPTLQPGTTQARPCPGSSLSWGLCCCCPGNFLSENVGWGGQADRLGQAAHAPWVDGLARPTVQPGPPCPSNSVLSLHPQNQRGRRVWAPAGSLAQRCPRVPTQLPGCTLRAQGVPGSAVPSGLWAPAPFSLRFLGPPMGRREYPAS